MVHHIIQKPTNKIEKLYIKNSILFIEGLAYVAGHNAPQFSDLSKHLRLLNTQTQATFEYELGSIR